MSLYIYYQITYGNLNNGSKSFSFSKQSKNFSKSRQQIKNKSLCKVYMMPSEKRRKGEEPSDTKADLKHK